MNTTGVDKRRRVALRAIQAVTGNPPASGGLGNNENYIYPGNNIRKITVSSPESIHIELSWLPIDKAIKAIEFLRAL